MERRKPALTAGHYAHRAPTQQRVYTCRNVQAHVTHLRLLYINPLLALFFCYGLFTLTGASLAASYCQICCLKSFFFYLKLFLSCKTFLRLYILTRSWPAGDFSHSIADPLILSLTRKSEFSQQKEERYA